MNKKQNSVIIESQKRSNNQSIAIIDKPKSSLIAYYGQPEKLKTISLKETTLAILQSSLYRQEELSKIREQGCQILGYLSLGEDHSLGSEICIPGSKDYHLQVNSLWGSVIVDITHPKWHSTVIDRARSALSKVDGLFLDTVDHINMTGMVKIVQMLHNEFPGAIFWINRGFDLLINLKSYIDGVIFESLSTSHTPQYQLHNQQGLEYTRIQLDYIQQLELPVMAIDYADKSDLAQLAYQRAADLNISTFVTDKYLLLPNGI